MNLIDQYVFEVGENLPEKQRADLEKEIRSLIEDTLDERSKSTGRAIDDALTVEVLKEFGSPAKMAASYQAPRYLIGPRLYPTFILVIKIVALVMLVMTLIGFGVNAATGVQTPQSIFELIKSTILNLFQNIMTSLGNVVLIFAIMERFVPQGIEKEKDWDPRKMKPVEEPDRINRFEQVWIIIWSSIAILLFNFYPQLLQVAFVQGGGWYHMQILSDAFFKYVPILTVLWGLEILLCVLLFMRGSWQAGTRWFQVVIKALNIIVLAVIIAGPPIFSLAVTGMPTLPGIEKLPAIFPTAYNGFRVLLVFVLVLECVELGKAIYRGITGKPFKFPKI